MGSVLPALVVLSGCIAGTDTDPGCEERGGGWEDSKQEGFDTELRGECSDGLSSTWVKTETARELWSWEYHTSVPDAASVEVVDNTITIMDGMAGSTGAETDLARHLSVLMASGLVANLDQNNSMETSCGLMSTAADCALKEYPDGCALPGPPPPEGNEPDEFCQAMNAIARTPFACVSSPLSQAVSFVAFQNLSQTANLWLTVTALSTVQRGMLWWPVWLASYAADAPSMMLFSSTDISGNPVHGVMVVHGIKMEVVGKQVHRDAFWAYVDAQLIGDTTVAPPDWSKLKIVMPSELVYQVVTEHNGSNPQTTEVVEWAWGDNLTLPNGGSAPWKFTQLVGIIDPCSANDKIPEIAGGGGTTKDEFCRIRGTSWANIGTALADAGIQDTFTIEPTCP